MVTIYILVTYVYIMLCYMLIMHVIVLQLNFFTSINSIHILV